MLEKENVLKTIKELPERFSIDELMEKIFFLYKVETGLEQSKKGEGISIKEFDERYAKWLK
jgi:hypothetical protein